jgi:hypothetical protein
MTPEKIAFDSQGMEIIGTLPMLGVHLAEQAASIRRRVLAPQLTQANNEKLQWALTGVLSRVRGRWVPRWKSMEGVLPMDPEERRAMAAELNADMELTELVFEVMQEVKKRGQETDDWLSTMAEPPSPEMTFERFVPERWRETTSSLYPGK